MASKKHRPEEAVAKLRQVDVLVSQGRTVAEAIRAIGVTEVTYDELLEGEIFYTLREGHFVSAALTRHQRRQNQRSGVSRHRPTSLTTTA